ncbi:MAG TPA: RNA-binding domain-containing protein [Candidatus Thalassarchaeaceae archaeon]|nr:RNA-binding domain-containing protein [Candidatus Thalassarchaeaceae archaeon]
MGRIEVTKTSGEVMGLHGGEWRIHASAVDDSKVISDALSWLSGGESEIICQKEKSALGAPMQTISVKMKSKQAMLSLGRVEMDSLSSILEVGLESRIDDDKFLHIRLDLGRLVQGEGVVSQNSKIPSAKGKFKLEVYPGQEAIDVAEKLIERLVNG